MPALWQTARADSAAATNLWADIRTMVNRSQSGTVRITLTGDVTVSGGNAHNAGNTVVIDLNGYTINGNGQQVFWNEKGTMTVKGGTIRNGKSDYGGAINNRGRMDLENVVIEDCVGNEAGGGILNYGTLTMTGGAIRRCLAGRGGALRIMPHSSDKSAIAQSATASLTNVEISGNKADGRNDNYGRGGAIGVSNGTLTMTGCMVRSNTSSDDDGGAIDFDASGKTLTLTNTTLSNNTVTQSERQGGGINLERGSASITGCTIRDNTARGDGGGLNIANTFGAASISGTTITGNTSADHSGGGIMNKATLTLQGTNTITGNTAKEYGGGIYFNGKALNIEGKLLLTDNHQAGGADNNLLLYSGKTVSVTGRIAAESRIGVTPMEMNTDGVVITSGFNQPENTRVFTNDDQMETTLRSFGNARYEVIMKISSPLSGAVLDKVTVSFHPVDENKNGEKMNSMLCIRDNGFGAGQNVVQLYNTPDSFRFYLTRADDDSYYIDFFGGADDYSPSNKRLDLSDNDGYNTVGNVVHVVKGNKTAMNKRWKFYRNSDGTYYIQNKSSGLYWDLQDDNYDQGNKLCQRKYVDAQKWNMVIVHADGTASVDQLKAGYDSYTFSYNGQKVTGSNWMSFLPDSTLVSDLTIPGTHDAATVQMSEALNSTAQCQQLSIPDQLSNGIRYFDLRLGRVQEGDNLADMPLVHGKLGIECLYHGETQMIGQVMGWYEDFLKNHPGETVIIQPKADTWTIGNTLPQDVYDYFHGLVAQKPWLFYIGDHIPTLKEARGKIVIISRIEGKDDNDYRSLSNGTQLDNNAQWALDAKAWKDWTGKQSDPLELTADREVNGRRYQVWTQDKFDIVGDDKWTVITNSVFNPATGAVAKRNAAKENGLDAWVVSYTSCVKVYPQNAARTINPKLTRKLQEDGGVLAGQYLGVVCSDFSDQQLAYLVYKQNYIQQEIPPAHVHQHGYYTVAQKEPTCTGSGTGYTVTYCTLCGEEISRETRTIPPLGHDWGPATYSWHKSGDTYIGVTASRVCDRDETHVETSEGSLTSETVRLADCETAGERIWYASGRFSGEDDSAWEKQMTEEIPATGHAWSEWEVVEEATEEKLGLKRRVCANNSAHIEEITFSQTESECVSHTWGPGEAVKLATCEETGIMQYTCTATACSATMNKTIPALGHDWGEWTLVNGTSHRRVCGHDSSHVQTENHTMGEWAVTTPATTEYAGEQIRGCRAEGCAYTERQEIPKLDPAVPAISVTPPEAKEDLIYDGTRQTLVTPGNVRNGTGQMRYALGMDAVTPPDEGWSDLVPWGVHAGTYAVWYRASLDSSAGAVSEGAVLVTIAPKEITVSGILAKDKDYDGTTTADMDCGAAVFHGLLPGDHLSVSATGTFDTAEPGEDKRVTISDLILGGRSESDYRLAASGQQKSARASIGPGMPISYSTVSGDGQTYRIGSGDDLIFTVKRSVNDELTFGLFLRAALDGQALAAGDYDTAQGSLVFTLKEQKAKTLSPGTHTLTFTFSDGAATAAFRVEQAEDDTLPDYRVPKTGDDSALGLWIGCILAGVIMIAATARLKKRMKKPENQS